MQGGWALAVAIMVAGCVTAEIPDASPTSGNAPSDSTTATTNTPATTSTATNVRQGSELRVHYVNVGQGDGVIWELPDGTIVLYDCGDAVGSAATNPVVQYLKTSLGRAAGSTIHALIASHGHLDHVGGCEEILQEYTIAHLYDTWYEGSDAPQSYTAFRGQVRAEGGILHPFGDDATLSTDVPFQQWDDLLLPASASGVRAQIIWPTQDASNWDHIADQSIVVRLTYGSISYCFQGDIEMAQENTIASYPQDLNCEVFLMGHHGSRYANSALWLQRMDPEYAPVSFGANGYGHPTRDAFCRVQQAGAQVYATHRLGTITIATDGATVEVSPNLAETADYCAAGANYWTAAGPTASSGPSPTSTSATPQGVEISQVQSDPPGTDGTQYNEEWVQLTNHGSTSVDLAGWTLLDEVETTYTFGAFSLAAGASVKIHTGAGTDSASDLYWGRSAFVWNNDHDQATLRDASGLLVDSKGW